METIDEFELLASFLYVNFETACMLQTLGFDWYTHKSFSRYGDEYGDGTKLYVKTDKHILRPTLYQAQKFLREKYDIHLLNDFTYNKHSFKIVKNIAFSNPFFTSEYNTYEQALSEGIEETCKYLLNEKNMD